MGNKYLAIYQLSFWHSIKNYKALIGLSIFLITCLIIFAHLWKIAALRAGALHMKSDQLLWFIALNEWVIVSIPDTQEEIEEDLRTGKLAYLLPRPISYLGATFFEACGKLTVNLLVLGFISFAFTWIYIGSLPFSFSILMLSTLFGILAGVVGIIFHMLVGLSAFWLQDITPFYWIWEKLMFMLGGLILPLSVYPQWLQTIASYTPFPAILGQRSALALDYSQTQIYSLLTSLLGWLVIGTVLLLIAYRKGLRILNIEGG